MIDVPGVMIASTSSAGAVVLRGSLLSIASCAVRRCVSRAVMYAAFCAGLVRSVASEAVTWVWPYFVASGWWVSLYTQMSCRVFIGAFAGSRARYAFMSRLNSGVRMSNGAWALGEVTVTVVAPSAWTTAMAAT